MDMESIETPIMTSSITSIIEVPKKKVPRIIFIVPYRDRVEHKTFFMKYIEHVMEDYPRDEWEYYFVHQKDTRPFNRGGMKNIGFLAIKYKYPNDYKNITLVFNDVDTLPYTKNILNYDTEQGVVKHFYGFKFALGGIFSIKASDFEMTNGFTNFWAWGCEDNYMQTRVIDCRLTIDRTTFFPIGSQSILQFVDGFKRLISRREAATSLTNDNIDGLMTIRNLRFEFNEEYIDVLSFDTEYTYDSITYEEHDIRNLTGIHVPTVNKSRITNNMKNVVKYGDKNMYPQQPVINYQSNASNASNASIINNNMPFKVSHPVTRQHNINPSLEHRLHHKQTPAYGIPIEYVSSPSTAVASPSAPLSKIQLNMTDNRRISHDSNAMAAPRVKPDVIMTHQTTRKSGGMRTLFM